MIHSCTAKEQCLFSRSLLYLCQPVPLPTGSLTRDFKHLAVDMYKTQEDIQPEDEEGEVTKGPVKLRVDCHFGKRKRLAAIRTCTSHVQVSRHGADLNSIGRSRSICCSWHLFSDLKCCGCSSCICHTFQPFYCQSCWQCCLLLGSSSTHVN